MKPNVQRTMRYAPYVAFFLSGASSLIFQTIWTRMLHHVFGATSVAISTVLTVFMAGLGLGTWISGKYASRIRNPIMAYAIAEIGVAVWSLLIPLMVQSDGWLADVNAWLRLSLGAESSTFMIARFLCVAPILLVPTTLMGSSLPLLSQHFARTERDPAAVSAKVGTLYAVNTFGAALGPFLSAFVVMPNWGLLATNWVACSFNLILAGLIFAFREGLTGTRWGGKESLGFLPEKEEISSSGPQDSGSESAEAPPSAEENARSASRQLVAGAVLGGLGIAFTTGATLVEGAGALMYALSYFIVLVGAGLLVRGLTQETESEPTKPKKSPKAVASEEDDRPWVPPAARYMAIVAFALSGAAALCYEVVWSRALSMTIGSSIYSFSLILETFLIGIASGAAAMSAFMGRGRTPVFGVAVTASALTMIAMSPTAIEIHNAGGTQYHGDPVNYALACLLPLAMIALITVYSLRSASSTARLAREGGVQARTDSVTTASLGMLAIPAASALGVVSLLDGYFPKIVASVVICITVFLALAITLRRHAVLLLALIQFFIAIATSVSYYWQDEIPYAFAQLVVSIDNLPDHVTTVQFFMFVTAGLCTLPATLGMGAMFPLTMRVWTSGGAQIGRDVAVVYTSNTIGSIVGSWLPGFILMPWLGMERTLHVGIALNMILALLMLIAGAAEPDDVATKVDEGDAPEDDAVDEDESDEAPPADEDDEETASASSQAKTKKKKPKKGADPKTKPARAKPAFTRTSKKADKTPSAPKRPRDLPVWHAAIVYTLSPLIPALLALGFILTKDPDSEWRWNLTQMTLGVFRVSLAEGMLDPESWGQPDLVYYHDGLSTTVSVERWGRHYALKNNGKVDASNGDDMPTQITVAAYPMLMHQDGPTDLDVAVIGFGSGVSVGTALSFPVRSVDVIELERAIPDAARFFEDVNLLDYDEPEFPYVSMDRLEVINDDGRNYLAATDRMYDVIISEPSNPWITGVSDLFTVDHFRITKRRLRPGGIYCQWVQLYELSPENIKTIYRTFAEQYQYVVVLAADDRSSDTVMLGSDAPLVLDVERMQRVWELPAVHDTDPDGDDRERMSISAQLSRAHLASPYDVYARVLLSSREEVLRYAQLERRRAGPSDPWQEMPGAPGDARCEPPNCERIPAPLNTDDNAIIEFAAPRDLIGFQRYERYLSTIYNHEWPYGRLDDHLRGFGEGDDRARSLAELALALIAHGRYDLAANYIEQSQQAGRVRETAIALEVLTHLLTHEHEPRVRIEAPVPGPEMDRAMSERLLRGYERVQEAVDESHYSAALVAMEDIPSPLRLHSGPSMRFLYGYLLFKAADGSFAQFRAAADQLEELLRSDVDYVGSHPEVYYYLARALDEEGSYPEALTYMRMYVESRLSATATDEAEVAEPPAGAALSTDAPGESDKTERDSGT